MYYHLITVVDYIVYYNIIQRRGTTISAISVVLKFAIFSKYGNYNYIYRKNCHKINT